MKVRGLDEWLRKLDSVHLSIRYERSNSWPRFRCNFTAQRLSERFFVAPESLDCHQRDLPSQTDFGVEGS